MKLYTEEQMHSVMLLALGRHGIYIPDKHYQDLIDLLTPIQLPSDEDIEKSVICSNVGLGYDFSMNSGFQKGAKWMRNKIKGGNNEQQ